MTIRRWITLLLAVLLALALLSTRSELDVCHITLLDLSDAADFFAFHSGDYEVKHFYSGGWS